MPTFATDQRLARAERGPRSAPRAGSAITAGSPFVGLLLVLSLAGCSHDPGPPPPTPVALPLFAAPFHVPADQPWVCTGIEVRPGEVLTVTAGGLVTVSTSGGRDGTPLHVGPEGTYLYEDRMAAQPFPLAAGALGPAPPFCLIGRIGDGPPFYVGPRKSWIVDRPGLLWLGINDFDFSDNCGELAVRIERPHALQPVAFQTPVPPDAPPGAPVCGASVVVFYIDGLRPDVVREMAAMGHLPNIRELFLDGGLEAARCYTAFPSDTITSNGTMWTGCFSDRHGIKGQVRFSRRTLHSQSYLDPMGPSRAARLVAPQGVDKVLHNLHAGAVGAVQGREAEQQFRQTHVTGTTPLFEHLRRNGGDWATGALPMMTEMPPLLWSRSIVRHLPYFHVHDAWNAIDEANTHYALFELLDRRAPVTIIWLPETDSVSHKCGRGQFGLTRRTIARADLMIGSVVDQLRALGRLECTYLILVSDHGHHGGLDSHLSQFDVANEFFYRPREMTPRVALQRHVGQAFQPDAGTCDRRIHESQAGKPDLRRGVAWTGGGLGLSVRQHRFWNRHKEDGSREFVFIDGDSDGAARIFLPRRCFRSGQWMGPHRPGDLLAYCIAEHLPPVNLIDSLTAIQAAHGNGYVDHPVDLVLVKLGDESVLVATGDRGYAVIDRRRDECGRWLYRYLPVEHLFATDDGQIAYVPAANPHVDPLGLVDVLGPAGLANWYDEQTWLVLTAGTRYPDSVVALARHMLWQENLRYRECEFAPDLVITARPGWYFGTYPTPGTTHGYPLADSMQATLFVAGPNIRRGARLDAPCRLVDLTPTILEMTGTPYCSDELDGRAVRAIYDLAACAPGGAARSMLAGPGDRAPQTPAPPAAGLLLPPAPQETADPQTARETREQGPSLGDSVAPPPAPVPPVGGEAWSAAGPMPVFWHDVDLGAWHPLFYQRVPAYPHLPLTVNDPESPLDLNNIVYNAASVTEFNVLRLFDDVLSPLAATGPGVSRRTARSKPRTGAWGDPRPVGPGLLPRAERAGLRLRTSDRPWLAGLPAITKLPMLTLSDYSQTSVGNLRRADAAIDWLQARSVGLERRLAAPLGLAALPGTRLVHGTIDGVQAGGWELYRFGQRVVLEVLDETLLSRTEDTLDLLINAPRREPAEVIVAP